MATYVLVPGAWLGGWAWREVAPRLRQAGHDVYPVTLTGLGERVHLDRPDVDLDTHIADVVNTLVWNDLDRVILVGHSYAGVVVTGVADRVPERIGRLVYLDSAPPSDGQRMIDFEAPESLAVMQQSVDEHGNGSRWPFPGFEYLGQSASLRGLSEVDRAVIAARATPQPWGTYTQPIRLRQDAPPTYEQVLIACDDVRSLIAAGIPPIVAMTKTPWRHLDLDSGHWPMFSAPEELAEVLIGLASD